MFFDKAPGAQSIEKVLNAIHDHLLVRNVQRDGGYWEGQDVDAAISRASGWVAVSR